MGGTRCVAYTGPGGGSLQLLLLLIALFLSFWRRCGLCAHSACRGGVW